MNLGASTAVTTTITDNDAATVSIAATTDGNEAGLVDGVFTVTLSTTSTSDTVIDYTVSGSAISGNDFTPLAGQVTILAGDTTATINVSTIDDGFVEGTENVGITLTGIASGDPSITIGGVSSASVDLFDNDAASWTISGDATVSEGAAASYAIALSGSFQNGEDASVDLALVDVDTTSSDYADFSAAVASAVAAYSGPGSYSLVGSTLTWTATADGQTPVGIDMSFAGRQRRLDCRSERGLYDQFVESGQHHRRQRQLGRFDSGHDHDRSTTMLATVSIAATTDANEAGLVNGRVHRHDDQSFQQRHGDQLHGGRIGDER